jgi:hypothetical protein
MGRNWRFPLGRRRSPSTSEPLGAEPDADQRLDPPLWPGGAAAGGGRSSIGRQWHLEVGGVAPVRGVVGGADDKEWMAADLSKLDLLVIQIDGIHTASI